MRLSPLLQHLFAIIAIAGYIANGAQLHLTLHPGERLSIKMCGGERPRTIQLEFKGDPAESDDEFCFSDCIMVVALLANDIPQITAAVCYVMTRAGLHPISITPRSPLWLGAPPQGPPQPLNA